MVATAPYSVTVVLWKETAISPLKGDGQTLDEEYCFPGVFWRPPAECCSLWKCAVRLDRSGLTQACHRTAQNDSVRVVITFIDVLSKTPFTRYNRLSIRFDNRLYRVNKHPTGCQTGLTTVLNEQLFVQHGCQSGLYNRFDNGFDNGFDNRLYHVYKQLPDRFDNTLYRVNGASAINCVVVGKVKCLWTTVWEHCCFWALMYCVWHWVTSLFGLVFLWVFRWDQTSD